MPFLLPDRPDPLPGHHQSPAYQRAIRARPVRLRPQGPGHDAQDGVLLCRGQGTTCGVVVGVIPGPQFTTIQSLQSIKLLSVFPE